MITSLRFQSLIERLLTGGYERSLIYAGLRGVGKTVLLMELDVLASEAGWATTDVQEVGSQPDFRVTFAPMAARLLREMSRRHRIKRTAVANPADARTAPPTATTAAHLTHAHRYRSTHPLDNPPSI